MSLEIWSKSATSRQMLGYPPNPIRIGAGLSGQETSPPARASLCFSGMRALIAGSFAVVMTFCAEIDRGGDRSCVLAVPSVLAVGAARLTPSARVTPETPLLRLSLRIQRYQNREQPM